jgi:Acyl-CoA reductase (LuxC)
MAFLLGPKQAVSNVPVPAFDPSRMHFLAELSRALLAHPSARSLPDVVTFAYWCRQAHLTRLKQQHERVPMLRMGLGMTFHICPANVPVNFAFSMAFGLLAGNTCVLRLPSKSTQTTEVLLETIRRVLDSPSQSAMADALLLLRFERDDAINAFWMSVADGRIVWGGDQTVALMRGYPSKARSREVAFSDRYSLCVLNPASILAMDPSALRQFSERLFNDIYLMDQAACSSPQLMVWVGEPRQVHAAQTILWPVLQNIAEHKYVLQAVQAVDKYVQACRSAMNNQNIAHIERHGNVLYRVALDNIQDDQDTCRGYFGTVHEVVLDSLAPLVPIVNERYQTLTVEGIDPQQIGQWIMHNGLRGVDRVVPVGRALDMDIVWDGYDIVTTLSRTVVI